MTNTTMSRSPPRRHAKDGQPANQCLLVVVEGLNDAKFLRRISRILHRGDASLPDLESLEREGRIVFLPFGGGNVAAWATRLEPLGCPELHLYDRESGTESRHRIAAAERVNARANCQAFVMAKRSVENYIHPRAIELAGGIELQFGDHDPVAELVAKERSGDQPLVAWSRLTPRARKHLRCHVKHWLNTEVVETMTPELLSERDPDGEVVTWLQTVAALTA